MKIDIIKIGNSKGVRLPKAILDQVEFGNEVELEVRGKEIVLRNPRREPREGWAEAIKASIDKHGYPDEEPWPDYMSEEADEDWVWDGDLEDKT